MEFTLQKLGCLSFNERAESNHSWKRALRVKKGRLDNPEGLVCRSNLS